MPTVTKTKRKKMLERQQYHCACCKTHTPTTTDARHDTVSNYMLCPLCMILIGSVRASLDRGVGRDHIAMYLGLPPLELPADGTQSAAEKRAAGRQAVIDKQVRNSDGSLMTIEQYDAQFGTDEARAAHHQSTHDGLMKHE